MTSGTSPRSTGGAEDLSGWEVLVLDSDERVRDALQQILSSLGLMVTATDDPERVLFLVQNKYFSVAVLDMDTPEEGYGLKIISRIHQDSPATNVLFLCEQESFEQAAQAFRLGANDVISKRPGNQSYLLKRVQDLCRSSTRLEDQKQLVKDTIEFLELFLKKLMDASRRARMAEEAAGSYSGRWDLKECIVLVVDDNRNTSLGLQEALGKGVAYRCVASQTGGEALDYAGQNKFHIALVKSALPDLPGTIVARSLINQVSDGLVLLFKEQGQDPPSVSLVDKNGVKILIPKLLRGTQLVEQIHELRAAYIAKLRERRHLEAFRNDHIDLLKQYVGLQRRLALLVADSQP